MPNKEIEIKLLFKNKKELISALKPQIKFVKRLRIYDRYFSQKHNDMKNLHSLVRIREALEEKNAKLICKSTDLTYKGKAKNQNNVWHRLELTTKVESSNLMAKILTNIGLKKISEYKNEKEYWKLDGLEIVFANFTKPARLTFMEIEGTSEKKILDLIKRLGNKVQKVGEEIFEVFDKKRNNTNLH